MSARRPPSLKVLSGTARPDRIASDMPALPAIDAAPSPPSWMTNLDSIREWQRLAPVLAVNRLLHVGNISILAQLCALHGRLVELWTAGSTPTAALLSAYRALSGDLGLSGMALPAPGDKPNRFSNNGKRR